MNLPNSNGTTTLPTLVPARQKDSATRPAKTPSLVRADVEAAKDRAFAFKVNVLVGIGILMAILSVGMMFALPWILTQ